MGHLELQHYLPWSVSSICYVEVVILLFDQLHRVVESSGASTCAAGRAGLGGVQGQVEQVRRRRAQGSGDRVEHGGRDSSEGSAFQLGVILDLTPARAATSPRRSPGTRRMPTSSRPARCGVILARREIRNSRISGTVVHVDGHYGLNPG